MTEIETTGNEEGKGSKSSQRVDLHKASDLPSSKKSVIVGRSFSICGGEVQSAQDKMPKGRTGAIAGQRAKKLTGESTLEESGSLALTYT